jgi:hypothetical protein
MLFMLIATNGQIVPLHDHLTESAICHTLVERVVRKRVSLADV